MSTETERPAWRSALTVAALYLLVASACHAVGAGGTPSTPVSLAAAVLLAAFVRSPNGLAVLAGGWVASTAWGAWAYEGSLLSAAALGLIETGSAWLGALAVRYRLRSTALSLHTSTRLLAGALLAALLGATFATLWGLSLHPGTGWWTPWRTWAFSTFLGIVLLLPVVLAYQGFVPRRSGGMSRPVFVAGLGAFAVFLVLALSVFSTGVRHWGTSATTLAYLPMPFLLAASMLWGPRGGSVAMLLGGLLIVARSASGAGPFAVEDAFAGEAVIEAQAFVALWAVLLLVGRSLDEERRSALATAQEWQWRCARTLAATGTLSAEFDPVTGVAFWNPGAEQTVGAPLAQVQNMQEWLAHVDPASQPLAQVAWQRAQAGQAVQADQYEVLRAGQRYWVEASLAPVRGPDGAVELVAAVLRVQTADGVQEGNGSDNENDTRGADRTASATPGAARG